MNAVDTNVLVYRVDRSDPVKQAKAKDLLRWLRKSSTPTLLLWQVAGEFLQRLRWGESQKRITRRQLNRYFQAIRRSFRLQLPADGVLDRSLDIADHFSLSHWDSMIVAACLEAGVNKLYTEDMGAPTQFDSLELVNPFV